MQPINQYYKIFPPSLRDQMISPENFKKKYLMHEKKEEKKKFGIVLCYI